MRALALISLLFLAACATKAHMRLDGAFVPLGNGEFVYATKADILSPQDSVAAESTRLALIDEAVQERRYCRSGYQIVGREMEASRGLVADSHLIRYRGRCK